MYVDFSNQLQKFIKNNLEQIHNVEITKKNVRDVVFQHFVSYRKMARNSQPLWKKVLMFWEKN
jgi:hypothetical protein